MQPSVWRMDAKRWDQMRSLCAGKAIAFFFVHIVWSLSLSLLCGAPPAASFIFLVLLIHLCISSAPDCSRVSIPNTSMTPAPSIVYSAVVINKASTMVRLRITYAMPEGSNVMEHVSIGPGGTLRLEEKTVQRGSAVFARHIHRIAIDGITHQRAVLQAPFKGVHSPVKDYVVEIYPMGGRLELRGVGRAK